MSVSGSIDDWQSRPGRGGGRQFDVFLSHNSRDKALVERIAELLKRAGLEPWLDVWSLVPGANWQVGLAEGLEASRACAVFVGPDDLGAWAQQEVAVALDRGAQDPDFRLFLVLLPGLPDRFDATGLSPFLRMRTWVDYRRGLDDSSAFDSLVAAIKGLAPGPDVPIEAIDDVSPYRGLEVFEEEHREFFFGREADVQRLLEKLKGTRFLAVLGASGSGKSSLVRAGLVPALRAAEPPWEIVLLRPGPRPLEGLAASVLGLRGSGAMQQTLDELAVDARTLHLAASLALRESRSGVRVLFVVDQFEEVFTLCRDDYERERRAFFATLLHAATIPDGPAGVVLTMRADFYHRCGPYPELAQQLAAQQYLVSPIPMEGLRQAIEEPARRVGLTMERGLAVTILGDVAAQPGALPLLEHALLELWERRSGGLLTLDGYRDSGGVQGAIAKRAEEVFESLTPPAQELARRTFLRLTQPGEGTEDTRRRAQLAELPGGGGEALDPLVDARLLTTSRDDADGKELVEVAHEALIRGWPRLRAWIDEDRAGLRVHRRLTDAAQEWERLGRDEGVLHRGARLAEAAEWREDNEEELNELEREFLDASLAAQKAEQEHARRRTRRLRMLAVVLAVFLLAAIAAAALAVDRTLEAERQSETALSRALAGEAPLHVRNELDLASLLAVESYRVQRTPEARAALTRLVQATARVSAIRVGGYTAATFSPNGETLALGTGGGEIRLWDVRGERFLAHSVDVGFVELLAYSGDGRTLATVGGRRLILWDAAGPRLEQRTVAPFPVYESGTLAVDRNGGTIAFTSGGGLETALVLWRVGTPRPVTLRPDAGLEPSAEFTRDGRTLVVVDGCCQQAFIRRFRIDAGRVREIPPTRFDRDCCDRTALSPGAEMVVAETNHDTVGVWDVPRGKLLKTYPSTAAGGYGIAIDRARSIAIGDWDGTITRYGLDLAGTSPEVLQGRRGSIYQVAFGRSGAFASVDNREGVIVWRLDGTLEAPVSERAATALTATESRAAAALRKRLARAPAFRGLDLDGAVIEVSPRGTTFALNLDAPEIVIGDVRRLIRLHTVRIPGDYAPSSMGYLDDDTLVAGQTDVRLWNTDSGEETHVLAHRSGDTVGNLEACRRLGCRARASTVRAASAQRLRPRGGESGRQDLCVRRP